MEIIIKLSKLKTAYQFLKKEIENDNNKSKPNTKKDGNIINGNIINI